MEKKKITVFTPTLSRAFNKLFCVSIAWRRVIELLSSLATGR
jgi:hypothetical protein